MELLIVVIIIGVVYSLSIGNFQKIQEGKEEVTLKSLKEYLNSYTRKSSVEILCLDDCSSCDIFVDGEKRSEDDSLDNFIDESIAVYKYDFNLGASKIVNKVHFNTQNVEKDVCFSFSIDNKGVGDQVLVEFKEKVYDFSTYLTSTPTYSSLKEATDAKDQLMYEVRQ